MREKKTINKKYERKADDGWTTDATDAPPGGAAAPLRQTAAAPVDTIAATTTTSVDEETHSFHFEIGQRPVYAKRHANAPARRTGFRFGRPDSNGSQKSNVDCSPPPLPPIVQLAFYWKNNNLQAHSRYFIDSYFQKSLVACM